MKTVLSAPAFEPSIPDLQRQAFTSMVSLTTSAPRSVPQQVLLLISQRKTIPVKRLRLRFHLSRELYFDLLDIVDIILELEHRFHIHIPDEVPFITVGDLVNYVVAETWGHIRR